MTLSEAIDAAVAKTGHTRFRALLDPASPAYRPEYERVVRAIAEGRPVLPAPAPAPQVQPVAPPAPSLFGMTRSAAAAAAKFVASGFLVVNDAAFRARLDVCGTCDRHEKGRCAACGCFTAAKARLPEEDCPLGKWAPLRPSDVGRGSQVSVGVPVAQQPTVQPSATTADPVDALVNACPHRGCKVSCGSALCAAGKGDRQGGREATIQHCRKCVTGEGVESEC